MVWFRLFFQHFSYFFMIWSYCYSILKAFIFFIDRIYLCFFVFYPIRRIYIWSITILIYFTTFTILPSTTFDWFQIIWISILSESKSYLITSFASSLIMISTFSFFECIAPSASLSIKEIKITAIVSWIFHVPDFLRLFVMPFKHGIISWSNDLMVRRRTPNPEVPCSKLLVGSRVDSALHPYKVPKVSTRNFWKLSGKKQTASLKWI